MRVNSEQQAVKVEPDREEIGSTHPISGLMSVLLGGILSVAAFSAASTHVESHAPVISVDVPASVAQTRPRLLQIADGDIKVGIASEAVRTELSSFKQGGIE
jgi:1-aminocyclopropane-1-carboxylate deaminase/D-cysteine desulfhydrase-like pyridoxal-dependent ACC family enzyme